MPNEAETIVEVTEADREAAADFLEQWEPGPEMTVVKLARAFARHRLAGEETGRAADRVRCAKVAEGFNGLTLPMIYGSGEIADAIRSGDPQ